MNTRAKNEEVFPKQKKRKMPAKKLRSKFPSSPQAKAPAWSERNRRRFRQRRGSLSARKGASFTCERDDKRKVTPRRAGSGEAGDKRRPVVNLAPRDGGLPRPRGGSKSQRQNPIRGARTGAGRLVRFLCGSVKLEKSNFSGRFYDGVDEGSDIKTSP